MEQIALQTFHDHRDSDCRQSIAAKPSANRDRLRERCEPTPLTTI